MVNIKYKIGAVVTAFCVISILAVGAMAWNPVEEGNVEVVKDFGDANGEVLSPGSNWITPVKQTTQEISTRQQAYQMTKNSKEGAKGYSDPVSVKTKDGVQVDFNVVVRYRLANGDQAAVDLYSDYKTLKNAEKRMIRPTVKRQFITSAGSMKTANVYTTSGQQSLTNITRDALEEKFSQTGLTLDSVQITGYKLPESYENAVTQKEVAYQNELKAEAQVEVAKQEANASIEQARGEARSNEIVGESLDENPGIIKIRYIEALKENNGTVYVGAGSEAGITLTRETAGD